MREIAAALANERVVTLRELLDKAVRVRRLSRFDYLLVGSLGRTECDILSDSSVAYPGVLKDHSVHIAELLSRYVAYVLAREPYLALAYVVKAHQ